jgi:hypothetical protein
MDVKTLIAIPSFDMVHTDLMESFTNLIKPAGTSYTNVRDTLINESRNIIAANAIKSGFDYVFWIDSDMKIPPDALTRMLAVAEDSGIDYLSGLYFTRRPPIKPCFFKELWWQKKEDESIDTGSQFYFDYPEGLVECAGSGFGCCLTSVELLKAVGDAFGAPFAPLDGMGEDVSFCWRVIQLGKKMYVDTTVKCGHVGQFCYDETAYRSYLGMKPEGMNA